MNKEKTEELFQGIRDLWDEALKFDINLNEQTAIQLQTNLLLAEISESLKEFTAEMKRSNDTVDELNRLVEEDASQIGMEFEGEPEVE